MGKRLYKPPKMVDYRVFSVDHLKEVFLFFMTWDIALEIFGYVGTVLVVISMLMTDINKLRIINVSGGIVSLVYALVRNTMPIAVMNFILIAINIVQLIKSKRAKPVIAENVNSDTTMA